MNSSSNQAANKNFRHDINGLRAWAVVAVVLYHFGVPGFTGGFVGVDIFFVISGFLMTSIIMRGLSEGRFSLWQFYMARARRIIPALAALVMVLIVVGWFTLPSTDYRLLGKHAAASISFLSNIVFWLEAGYFDAASKEKWLLHTWSLSVEWQFYLILPLALLAAWKLWPGRGQITLLVALGFIVSLALSIGITPGNPSAAFYLLPTRAWEMLAGGLVYLLAHRCPTGARAKLLERLGFGLIVASVLVLDEGANWPGATPLMPVAGAVLVLMAAQSRSTWTSSRIAQWLGNASYSIYLWHWPIVVASVYLGFQNNPAAIALGLSLALVLGHLSYALVETPTRRHLGQLRLELGIATLAAATAGLAAPGVAIRVNDGFEHRLPPSVEAAARGADDKNPRRDLCMARGGITSPSCRYGGEQLGAVVIGDSHAAAVVTAINSARPNPEYGVMELSYAGCPTLFGVKRRPPPNPNYQCAEFNSWALEKLRTVPGNVPLIIINRASNYALGDQGSKHGRTPYIHFTRQYMTAEPAFLHEFAEHLIDSACIYAKSRSVYLVRPFPEMGENVPKAVARALMLGIEPQVSISMDAYHARNSVVWAAQDEARRRCGAKILNPLPYLCQGGRCIGSRDGRPLYFDDNHLNEYGNKLLVPMFAEVFAPPKNKQADPI